MSFPSGLFDPTWDWIQVEVTTRCNAACVYCPRTVYSGGWQSRDLDWETFEAVSPAFRQARLVHLQGWGEPLLHPRFLDMLAALKAVGKWVGTTSNGLAVTPDLAERLVAGRLDLLALSLAGTDVSQDRIRAGAPLERVLEALAVLEAAKRRAGSRRPALHVAFLLLRSGLPGLARLPALLEGRGVSQVMVSTLDYLCAENLAPEALTPADHTEVLPALEELAREAEARNLEVAWSIPGPGPRRGECTENVGRALVVGADGGVHPCVIGNLPVDRGCPLRPGLLPPPPPLVFGNVREATLTRIWKSPAYRAFRRSFRDGSLHPACRACSKLFAD